MTIEKGAGSLLTTISEAALSATEVAPSATQEAVQVSVHLETLLVDIWDDERRRLSGGRPPCPPWPPAAKGAPEAPIAAGARLFAISADNLRLQLLRHQVAGAKRCGLAGACTGLWLQLQQQEG